MSNYNERMAENAKLSILQILAKERDGTLNQRMLTASLDAVGHRRSPEYVVTQLQMLADLGAIKITHVGDQVISQLTNIGKMHIGLRIELGGVEVPDFGD